MEQNQMLDTSIVERNLNQQHKDLHKDSSQCKKALSKDGSEVIIQISPPDPSYMIETHMPLSKTPRLDLYFTNSELTTISLLAMACIEYLCKDEYEYCFVHFKRHSLAQPPLSLPQTKRKKSRQQHQCHEKTILVKRKHNDDPPLVMMTYKKKTTTSSSSSSKDTR